MVEMLAKLQYLVSADVLYVLLLVWVWFQIKDVLWFLHAHLIKGPKNLKKVYGSWAVVTGATDGIGKGMAAEFARQGLNVMLISRTQSKLDDCAKELREKYPKIQVSTLSIDFNEINDLKVRAKIAKALAPLEVGVLVNNVGISYPFPKFVHELTEEETEALTVLNVDSTVWMTRLVLGTGEAGSAGMVARKKGAIINIASIAGVLTSPLLAHYGGAKGFVAQYSRGLHYEYAPKGIHVQCQVPFYVTTKLAKLRHASLTVATPAQYARAAIKAIGSGVVVSPFWSHHIQFAMYNALPEWLLAFVANKMHLGIRKAGMRKMEKLAAEGKKN